MSPMVKLPLSMEYALLGLLQHEPMHAYEMHQRLEEARALGLVWHTKQSQLYAMLTRLEEAGYLTSSLEPQGNRPPRKMLQLTDSGQQAFERWLVTPVSHGRDFRLEFLAKLFFAVQRDSVTSRQLIADQQQVCQQRMQLLVSQAESIHRDQPYEWLVIQFRIQNLEAILGWLDTCVATFSELETQR